MINDEMEKAMRSIPESMEALSAAREEIFTHVGYVEQWRQFVIDPNLGSSWSVDSDEKEALRWADSAEMLEDDDAGEYYEACIYTQRHHKKWVFRGPEYTLVLADTQTDGNIYLFLFDNSLEVKGIV